MEIVKNLEDLPPKMVVQGQKKALFERGIEDLYGCSNKKWVEDTKYLTLPIIYQVGKV